MDNQSYMELFEDDENKLLLQHDIVTYDSGAKNVVDWLESELRAGRYRKLKDKSARERLEFYIDNEKLSSIFGYKKPVITDILSEWQKRNGNNLQLEILTGSSESGTEKWRLTGKEAAIYAVLAFPTLVPGIMYMNKKCKGTKFIITTTTTTM